MNYKLGIDVGSTTLKFVILDQNDHIVYKSYTRHKSKVRSLCLNELSKLKSILDGHNIQVAITGSAGLGIANDAKLPFVQEVFASVLATQEYYPQSDVAVELGGEDAKIIFFKGALEERMNSTCAGGTGAFIDQMASLLNISLEEMDALSLQYDRLYPIASRCGVFAKSDIQPLINQGVSKSNLSASIFQAVVDQCIAGLAQGREIKGTILFLGGPLSFLDGLKLRFKETLQLDEEHAIFPELAPYFVALGSALYAKNEKSIFTYDSLLQQIKIIQSMHSQNHTLPPLFENDEEYKTFIERHHKASIQKKDIKTYSGPATLGIDSGSTTTKILLMDQDANILYEKYTNNKGNPVDIIHRELLHIYDLMEDRIQIVNSCVTGYGEELIKHAFHLDHGVVETMAHYRGAKHFNPNVDFIIDIGGQDMKCFRIKDKTIDDIILNEACSSGCGSFIETFANSMGYNIKEFAALGLNSQHPVDLGTRCTVFMNSSVKQAQKNGASIEDISAGLCLSVVKNALYKVIRLKNADEIGKEIVVQGGTFLNDTILRSFELELNKHVIRPAIAHLMGAFGCALIAKDHPKKASSILTKQQLQDFKHTSIASNCKGCTNHCNLTINRFSDGSSYIAGNKCERPITGKQKKDEYINLYDYKYSYLRNLPTIKSNKKIGIPLILNLYDTLPFWNTFFSELGYEVVLSKPSSKQLYSKAQHTIPSDTVCYPAKTVHGAIQSLIDQNVDYIFYPCMSYNFDEHISDNHYNCPVVAYYPEVIDANMQLHDIPLLSPYVYLEDASTFVGKISAYFQRLHMNINYRGIQKASESAYKAYHQWKHDIKEMGLKAIQQAKQLNKQIIVLAGRPYHIDPFINHGISTLLSNLDCIVMSEDSIPPQNPFSIHVLNQWTFHARMYHAAKYVSMQPNMEFIQLVSFGCGLDAITGDECKEILRSQNKLYTQIKIDEIDNLGAIKIRCRSLLEASAERKSI